MMANHNPIKSHINITRIAFGVTAFVLLALVPLLALATPQEHPLHLPDPTLLLLGKFACYAIVAIAVDLIWGFAGILSLGHGVFFALGGYAMGMHLMLAVGDQGVYRSRLPDFMVFLDWKELPWFWKGFDQIWFALLMSVAVPSLLAYAIGYLTFRSRIRGVYISLITQALTFALMLLFFRNETGLGGNNGLTNFKELYGYSLANRSTKVALYFFAVFSMLTVYGLVRFVVASRFGVILRAIRDVEPKARFCGYDTLKFKLLAWTLSAAICGLAGALYVPLVGMINPSEMQPANSIEMVIWVAMGGRGTIIGPAIGAFVVNAAKSYFTVAAPELWLFLLGSLFVLVTLLLPEGLVSLRKRLTTHRGS
jgi:urea transport system permease protein